MSQIGVYILDSHPMMRAGIHAVLSAIPDLNVVGDSNTSANLWRELDTGQVHVVLVDLHLTGEMPAFEVLKRMQEEYPTARALIVAETMPAEITIVALKAGAAGVLQRDAAATQIALAIRSVVESYQVFHPTVIASLVEALEKKPEELPLLDGIPYLPMLTTRENEVLRLLATGLSNQSIADQLIITEATVKTHLNNIYSKLKLSDRIQAVFYAMRVGLATAAEPTAGQDPTTR